MFQVVFWEPPDCHSGLASRQAPQMPPNDEDWLTAGQLALLERWIQKGAPQFDPEIPGGHLTELDFPSAQECKACHPKQYQEWSRSMHAYAQKSPVFEAFALTMSERTNGTIGTFCTRCHTPVGTALGESGLVRNEHRSRLSLEGVTCVVCHRRSHKHGRVNGLIALDPGPLETQCMYGPFDDPVLEEPQRHPAAGSNYLKTSTFCGSCHDVTNPQGLRLEEAFSEWRNSPAARESITCHHCHMGPEPGKPVPPDQRPWGYAAVVPGSNVQLKLRPLSDHTFAGPDYSLLPDTEFPEKLDWMYEIDYSAPDRLSPFHRQQLEELRARNQENLAIATMLRHRLLRNAASLSVELPSDVRPGQNVRLAVTVTSEFKGHNFPTGFSEERQLWVEVTVRDEQGNVVYQSGDLDPNGDLRDALSHAVLAGAVPFDKDLMNFQSRFMVLTDRGTERQVTIPVNRDLQSINILRPAIDSAGAIGRPGVLRVHKTSLPPGASRTSSYRFHAPKLPQRCSYHVRLLFRHLPPHLLDKIGVPHLKPPLEIVIIDEVAGEFQVSGDERPRWISR